MNILQRYLPSVFFLFLAITLSLMLVYYPSLTVFFHTHTSGIYLSIALIFIVGIGLHQYSPTKVVPVYVWAILFGMALQLPLLALVADKEALLLVVNFFAAFILFASGIHVPIKNFKKYFAPIAALSIVGTLLSILLFAISLSLVTQLYGFTVSAITLLILAAILSSVDPTTVINTLEHLHFRKPFLRDIAISESAVNDVVGIILTRFFLIAALGTVGAGFITVQDGFLSLLTLETFIIFSAEVMWGVLIGLLGAWVLQTWGAAVGKKHWSDPALFFSVPIFCFALGSLIDGSGFLAAFIAGLLFENHKHTQPVHEFFEGLVDRFMKPIVFVLLGVLAPLYMLLDTFAIGTLVALLFMFAIRPLVVYISLLPWLFSKDSILHWQEVVFLSLIRETGTVPAVLVLLTVALGIIRVDFIFAIALWVIIYTLIIEPPLTPIIAKQLKITR